MKCRLKPCVKMLLYIFIITFIFGEINIFASSTVSNSGPRLPLIVNGNSSYYFGLIHQGTAAQAEGFCRYHNMDLLSIETPEEHAFIEETLLNILDLNSRWTFLWTSGKRSKGGNKYGDKWIWGATGLPVHYTNWWPGQPDNANGIENCLELWHQAENPGKIQWNDYSCDDKERYLICEYNNKAIDNV